MGFGDATGDTLVPSGPGIVPTSARGWSQHLLQGWSEEDTRPRLQKGSEQVNAAWMFDDTQGCVFSTVILR